MKWNVRLKCDKRRKTSKHHVYLPVCTVTQSKNKLETIRRQKLRISNVIKDWEINNFCKSKVRAVHRSWVICRKVPCKFIELIYMLHYGDAMLVPLRGTPTTDGRNQWKHLELSFAKRGVTFPCELISIHINTSPITWTVQTASFSDDSFVTVPSCLMSRPAEISKIQDAVFLTQRMLLSWKLMKR